MDLMIVLVLLFDRLFKMSMVAINRNLRNSQYHA